MQPSSTHLSIPCEIISNKVLLECSMSLCGEESGYNKQKFVISASLMVDFYMLALYAHFVVLFGNKQVFSSVISTK